MYVLLLGGESQFLSGYLWTVVMFISWDTSICCWFGCSDGKPAGSEEGFFCLVFFVNFAVEKEKLTSRIVKAQTHSV